MIAIGVLILGNKSEDNWYPQVLYDNHRQEFEYSTISICGAFGLCFPLASAAFHGSHGLHPVPLVTLSPSNRSSWSRETTPWENFTTLFWIGQGKSGQIANGEPGVLRNLFDLQGDCGIQRQTLGFWLRSLPALSGFWRVTR